MKLKTVIIQFGILFVGCSFYTDAQEQILTFDNALEITRQNSHVLKQMAFLRAEKDEEAKAAKGYYLPKVGLMASYMMMSDKIHLDLTPVKDAITPIYSTLSKYGVFSDVPNTNAATNAAMPILPQSYSTAGVRSSLAEGLKEIEAANWDETIQEKQFGLVAATFMWPIYTGGKIRAANAASQIERKEAEETTRQKEGELLSELVERYFGLCLAQQAVEVRMDVCRGMQKHLSDASKIGKQGLIANAEVLHAKVYNAQSERELSQTKRTVQIINQGLLSTLGLDTVVSIKPISALFYLDSVETLNYYKQQAEANNPQLKQVDSKRELAQQNLNVHRSEYIPTVAVQGLYNVVDKDYSPYLPDWTVGVGMKWTIFDGTARYRKVQAASAKINQANEARQKASTDISTIVEKLYNEMLMYREQLTALDTARVFAQEYLRLREKGFKEEMSNSTEVVDAQLALAKVSMERLQAMYGYDLTLARLLQYCGVPEKFNEYRTRKDAKTEAYKSVN